MLYFKCRHNERSASFQSVDRAVVYAGNNDSGQQRGRLSELIERAPNKPPRIESCCRYT